MKEIHMNDATEAPRQLGIRITAGRTLLDFGDDDLLRLKSALDKHGVVCLKFEVNADPNQIHEFVGRWGEVVQLTPGLSLTNEVDHVPTITRVGNVTMDGRVRSGVRFAEYWHHDGDMWSPGENYIVSFLYSVIVPSKGGATGFFDTQLAYQALDEEMKHQLGNAVIEVRPSEIADFQGVAADDLPSDSRHPVVLTHPHTGERSLYLPDSSTGIRTIDGIELGRVEDLLRASLELTGVYEHCWSPREMLIFDNLQVMHRSLGGYGDEPRLLFRCQARL